MFFLTCRGCSLSSRATTLASLSYFAIIAYKDISTDVIAFVDSLMLFAYLRRFVIVSATKLSFLVCYHNFVVCKAQDFNISSDDFLKFFKLKVCSVLWVTSTIVPSVFIIFAIIVDFFIIFCRFAV